MSLVAKVFAALCLVASAASAYSCGDWLGEFFLAQDLSRSYVDDLPILKRLSRSLFTGISDLFPNALMGVGSFSEKNVKDLGTDVDVCYRTDQPLTTDIDALVSTVEGASLMHGGDNKESQYDALFHGLKSQTVGWTNRTHNGDGVPLLRVMILATDSEPHVAGDAPYLGLHEWQTEPNCTGSDYPSDYQVNRAFAERDAWGLFLVKNVVFDYYTDLVAELKISAVVRLLNHDSSNMVEEVLNGLAEISCAAPTRPPPVTPPPTPPPSTQYPPATTEDSVTSDSVTSDSVTSDSVSTDSVTSDIPLTTTSPPDDAPPPASAIPKAATITGAFAGAVALLALLLGTARWMHAGDDGTETRDLEDEPLAEFEAGSLDAITRDTHVDIAATDFH